MEAGTCECVSDYSELILPTYSNKHPGLVKSWLVQSTIKLSHLVFNAGGKGTGKEHRCNLEYNHPSTTDWYAVFVVEGQSEACD